MQILSSRETRAYIVETDDDEFPTYRTNGKGYWENLVGTSWEEVGYCEEIEEQFRKYISRDG